MELHLAPKDSIEVTMKVAKQTELILLKNVSSKLHKFRLSCENYTTHAMMHADFILNITTCPFNAYRFG